jgi:hypothetical protein
MQLIGVNDPGWNRIARQPSFLKEVEENIDRVEKLVYSGQKIEESYFGIFETDLQLLFTVQTERKLPKESTDWTMRVSLVARLQAAKKKQLQHGKQSSPQNTSLQPSQQSEHLAAITEPAPQPSSSASQPSSIASSEQTNPVITLPSEDVPPPEFPEESSSSMSIEPLSEQKSPSIEPFQSTALAKESHAFESSHESIACAAGMNFSTAVETEPANQTKSPLFTATPESPFSDFEDSDLDTIVQPLPAEITAAKIGGPLSANAIKDAVDHLAPLDDLPSPKIDKSISIISQDEDQETLGIPEGLIPVVFHKNLGITGEGSVSVQSSAKPPATAEVLPSPPLPVAVSMIPVPQLVTPQRAIPADRGYCRQVIGSIARCVSRKTRISRARSLLHAIDNTNKPNLETLSVKNFSPKGMPQYLFILIWWIKNQRKSSIRKQVATSISKLPLEQQFLAYTVVEKGSILHPRYKDGPDSREVRKLIKKTLQESYRKATEEQRAALLEILRGEVSDARWCEECIGLLTAEG